MTRSRTGSVEPFTSADGSTYYRARVRLADGSRERRDVPESHATPAGGLSARDRAAQWAEGAQQAEDTTHKLLKARKARTAAGASGTVDAFADAVFDQRKIEGKSAASRERRLWSARVSPKLGALQVVAVTKEQIEDFREHLDSEVRKRIAGSKDDGISGKYALNIWTLVRTVFREASASRDRAKRVREDDPTTGVLAPLKTRARKKTFLHPAEFRQLLACDYIPIAWRETYAIAAYLYLRPGELRALTWEHVNFAARVVSVVMAYDEEAGATKPTKTERGQREVPIPAELVPLLERLRGDRPATDPVAPLLAEIVETGHGRRAVLLRKHLRLAGVDRPRLLADTATTMAVNFRSLRDSGITWEALAGTPVDRIQARAGHEHIATTIGYCKAVEDLRGKFGTPFAVLEFGGPSCGIPSLNLKSKNSNSSDDCSMTAHLSSRLGPKAKDSQPRSTSELSSAYFPSAAQDGSGSIDVRTTGQVKAQAIANPANSLLRLQDSNLQESSDSRGIHADSRAEEGTRDDVSARSAVAVGPSPETSDDALKLAIKLAVDAGDYHRAKALLEFLAPAVVATVVDLSTRSREG